MDSAVYTETLALGAGRRSETYWFLGRFYATRPDPGFLGEVRAHLDASADGQTSVSADEVALRRALDDADVDALSGSLSREYTRLFRGIREDYGPPPPYESLYRNGHPMGEATVAVIQAYAAAGYGAIDVALGPQDHVAAELKFMAMLCHDEMTAWNEQSPDRAIAALEHQRGFLEAHLGAWIPAFCKRITGDAHEPFYAAVAGLTERIVAADRGVVIDLLADLGAA